ncbi:restriction endonuclease subunit S [Methylomicrobium sp. Wu6]|uniref:restriction endonuclease subunit S n=1 Tax=Methylomicrobium sp. Wu6 TaxID=3107928 RepID=UPI002DD680C7|nr:restriction endonuclease subunit S [Methylomicrobium sp. Wu6]MEC4748546.1 restriction endonuclease subunit S [Methylomicrobium sp. Wu6]
MNAEQLLQHFDRISEAPDAIARLRRFILDLAVRGKLVEQDPNDEPASELVKRIQLEKHRLVKEGKVKLQEPLPSINDGEIEYEIPPSWQPTRIGGLLTVIRGASPRPKGDPKYFSVERTGYHWIKISDIRKHSKNRVLYDTDEFLTEAGMEKSVLLPKGTLIMTNSATIGVPIFLGFEGGCIHDGYLAFPYFPDSEISKDFFFILLQTLESYALKMARGMAQLNLNTGLVRNFPLGLPPLAEQHRIVAKVDQLMALCDQLQAAQNEREQNRDRLVAASLHRLNQPADDEAVNALEAQREQAHFLFNHLPRLTTRPEHIKQLRQTILNLAVRGKLVPQDPNDEPASELLKRIQIEKGCLSKKDGSNNKREFGEKLFDLPSSWGWATLGELALSLRYGTSIKCSYEQVGSPVLRIPNIDNGRIDSTDLKFGSLSQRELDEFRLEDGDILMIRSNGSLHIVGRPALVESHCIGYSFAGYLVRLRFSKGNVVPRYLVLALNSTYARDQIEIPIRSAVGLKNINSTEISLLHISLPPLAEQHRIVAKVDELMALCDQLETQLTDTATDSRRLLEAVLHGALLPVGQAA